MAKSFVRSEDVRAKLHNTLIEIKGMPFWVYHLAGTVILCCPLFDPNKDVPSGFWSDFQPQKDVRPGDHVAGCKTLFAIDANSEHVSLAVPDIGYVNVYDHSVEGKKSKLTGVTWLSRRPVRSGLYGIHTQSVLDTPVAGATNVFHRYKIFSLGAAVRGKFPSLTEAIELLKSEKYEALAFDKSFCLVKPQAENPFRTIFYNNVKVAVIGKKVRILPSWRKPWFEKLLVQHTWALQ
jgi:hypothetical protein